MTVKRPNSRRNLDYAIQRAFGTGRAYVDVDMFEAEGLSLPEPFPFMALRFQVA